MASNTEPDFTIAVKPWAIFAHQFVPSKISYACWEFILHLRDQFGSGTYWVSILCSCPEGNWWGWCCGNAIGGYKCQEFNRKTAVLLGQGQSEIGKGAFQLGMSLLIHLCKQLQDMDDEWPDFDAFLGPGSHPLLTCRKLRRPKGLKDLNNVQLKQGKSAYSKGQYMASMVLFQEALEKEGEFSALGGEIQLWLALAYQVNPQHW